MLLVTSCATDIELEVAPTAQSNKFYASIEAPATRTYADEDGKLLWNTNDEITLFQGNAYPRQFQFKGETGKNYGEFEEINPPTGVISANPLEANYAIYPYAANTTISNILYHSCRTGLCKGFVWSWRKPDGGSNKKYNR